MVILTSQNHSLGRNDIFDFLNKLQKVDRFRNNDVEEQQLSRFNARHPILAESVGYQQIALNRIDANGVSLSTSTVATLIRFLSIFADKKQSEHLGNYNAIAIYWDDFI